MGKDLKRSGKEIDLTEYVDGGDGIYSVRQVDKIRSWNNIEYGAGLSGKNTPATTVSYTHLTLPTNREV